MNEATCNSARPEAYVTPVAVGTVIGACLSLLGTPIVVVLLLAGVATAYAFGWRIVVSRKTTNRITDL